MSINFDISQEDEEDDEEKEKLLIENSSTTQQIRQLKIKNEKSVGATQRAKRKLIYASLLSVTFMVVEIIGGYVAGSLAVMSDAAHLITDSLTFIIGIVGVVWGEKGADSKMSFGYQRIEIVCAVISVVGIWIMTIFISYFAIDRIFNPSLYEIDTDTMLIVAILGIIVNIVMALVLHGGSSCHHHNHSHDQHRRRKSMQHQHGRSSGDDEMKVLQIDDNDKTIQSEAENINVQAALLHVLGDFLQSVGVILAAVIIKIYPEAKFVDPLITIFFSIIVIFTTIKIMMKSYHIVMESVPDHIDYDTLKRDLKNIYGITSINQLRIWNFTQNHPILTAKIIVSSNHNSIDILEQIREILYDSYDIEDMTIEIEVEKTMT